MKIQTYLSNKQVDFLQWILNYRSSDVDFEYIQKILKETIYEKSDRQYLNILREVYRNQYTHSIPEMDTKQFLQEWFLHQMFYVPHSDMNFKYTIKDISDDGVEVSWNNHEDSTLYKVESAHRNIVKRNWVFENTNK